MKVPFLLFLLLRPRCSTTISRKWFKYSPSIYHETDPYHNAELYDQSAIASDSPWSIKAVHNPLAAVRCEGRHYSFSIVVRMRTCSLVPRPNTTITYLGTRLVHERNRECPRARPARSLPVVMGKVYEHHTSKVLHSAANL